MTDLSLPKSFEVLEPLVATWALATQDERQQRRIHSSRGELRAFYDAMQPRLPQWLSTGPSVCADRRRQAENGTAVPPMQSVTR